MIFYRLRICLIAVAMITIAILTGIALERTRVGLSGSLPFHVVVDTGRSAEQAVPAGPGTFKETPTIPIQKRETTATLSWHSILSEGQRCYLVVEWPVGDRLTRFITVDEGWCEEMR